MSDRPTGPGPTLDLGEAPTVLLIFAANRFTRIWSRYLQRHYGLAAIEWRMMVMLTAEPNIPVTRASTVIDIDKASVSRALARLEAKGLAEAGVPQAYRRRRLWRLTADGAALHDEILAIALRRQARILDGLDDDVVRQLSGSLRTVLDNIADLEVEDP